MNRLEDSKSESPFPVGEENTAFAKYFIGQQIGIANVTFEPGCRNHWHIHHGGGQILLCTAGRGYYQAWGQEARELHPGDVVNILPEEKHWHGAAPDSWFSHIAISVPAENVGCEWLEPVTDEYVVLK